MKIPLVYHNSITSSWKNIYQKYLFKVTITSKLCAIQKNQVLYKPRPHFHQLNSNHIDISLRENTDYCNSKLLKITQAEKESFWWNMIVLVLMHILCLKSVRIRSFSGPYFLTFGLNTSIFPYSVQMRE